MKGKIAKYVTVGTNDLNFSQYGQYPSGSITKMVLLDKRGVLSFISRISLSTNLIPVE